MKKELTAFDWALCIGQKIEYDLCGERRTGKLISIEIDSGVGIFKIDNGDAFVNQKRYCKPVFRSLNQITEEEKEELCDGLDVVLENHRYRIVDKIHDPCGESWEDYTLEVYDWLTQKGFDIRNFIQDGLAIRYEEKLHGKI